RSEPDRFLGEMKSYQIQSGDNLPELAREFNLGFIELRAANPGVDPHEPEVGTRIILPTRRILPENIPHKGIVINLADLRLYYFDNPKNPPLTHPVAIGREGLNTPLGVTTIQSKVKDPTWRPTDRMRAEDPTLPAVVPPGPDNPLGDYA